MPAPAPAPLTSPATTPPADQASSLATTPVVPDTVVVEVPEYKRPPVSKGGVPWWIFVLAGVAAAGAGGAAFYMSRQPSGQTQVTLGQKL